MGLDEPVSIPSTNEKSVAQARLATECAWLRTLFGQLIETDITFSIKLMKMIWYHRFFGRDGSKPVLHMLFVSDKFPLECLDIPDVTTYLVLAPEWKQRITEALRRAFDNEYENAVKMVPSILSSKDTNGIIGACLSLSEDDTDRLDIKSALQCPDRYYFVINCRIKQPDQRSVLTWFASGHWTSSWRLDV